MADGNVLLVEGKDDQFVLKHLTRNHGIPEDSFKIKPKDGISVLLDTLDVELLASDVQRLGIVVDADLDIASRWQSLRNILSSSGYQMPDKPEREGIVVSLPGLKTVGVWIMPDNSTAGLLEDFMSWLIPHGDPNWNKAKECVEEIDEDDRRFAPEHLIKAQVHTWLAWQADPGTPLGLAITKRYFDAGSAQAAMLVGWIRRLFELPAAGT